MAYESSLRRYRQWYVKLLRFYPRSYYERFGEGMRQVFSDVLKEHTQEERGLFGRAFWMFIETSGGILKENITLMIMQNTTKRLSILAVIVALILMIPLVAMQFTTEVKWTLFDFIFMGALLFGTGLVYELVARTMNSVASRVALGIAVVTGLLLVWINGAVGIIGDGPVNMLYAGVLVVGFVGALIARFKPRGMSYTLFAMALAQALVPVIALVVWKSDFSPGVLQVFLLNTVFVASWIGSGWLFWSVSNSKA